MDDDSLIANSGFVPLAMGGSPVPSQPIDTANTGKMLITYIIGGLAVMWIWRRFFR